MIHRGDLFDVLPTLAADSIDACVTDGPYGIGFMGREWDTFKPGTGATRKLMHPREREAAKIVSDNPNINGRHRSPALSPSQIDYDYSAAGLRRFQEWTTEWAALAFRALKPGAYILSCGAPRSYHRMACGIEDAGFEVRDCFSWLFGSGYPKSVDVGRAIDMYLCHEDGRHCMRKLPPPDKRKPGDHVCERTESGKAWDGWGSGLKPANEPILVARKPFKGALAKNVLNYGTAALNIDACRVPASDGDYDHPGGGAVHDRKNRDDWRMSGAQAPPNDIGRWPANVLLDEEAAAFLDEQVGELVSGFMAAGTRREGLGYNGALGDEVKHDTQGDRGGPSRFYYVAKPSRRERDKGCYDLPERTGGEATNRKDGSAGLRNPRAGAGRNGGAANIHPTVKPVELMRWLVRLVTPPDGVVLDPFGGSFTTAMACVYEQRRFIIIEREPEYVEIGVRRVQEVCPLFIDAEALRVREWPSSQEATA